MDQREFHKQQNAPHETKVKDEGSARRNIIRKSNPADAVKGSKKQHGGGGGKGKWNDLDDGSLP